jgi:UDP-N-acetylmuramoylalanine--D-glutamate ligase
VYRAGDFEQAVRQAAAVTPPGGVVLLSPACASYDMFPNFAARGQRFREIVQELSQEENAG